MSLRSRLVPATLMICFLFGVYPNAVQAQPEEGNTRRLGIMYDNPTDLFYKAITYESGDAFNLLDPFANSFNIIFGLPTNKSAAISGFPENQIVRDHYLLHVLYKDYLEQQAGGEPIITRDLENPFGTSLGSPDYPEP